MTTRPIDLVLRTLGSSCRAERDEHKAKCPCHNDSTDPNKWSLSVKEDTDHKVLLHCFAGCDTRSIVDALGLKMTDLFVKKDQAQTLRSKIVATYDYLDEQGELLYQVVRYDPKSFNQRRPDGQGKWLYKLGDVRRVLYRLASALAAKERRETIYFCEGEKDAENLAKFDIATTTNAMGANKWDNEYTRSLDGCSIVLIPDNDTAGYFHSFQIITHLYKKSEIKVLTLPDLPDKGDVSDWLKKHKTKEEFLAVPPVPYTEWLLSCVEFYNSYIKGESDPAKLKSAGTQLKQVKKWMAKQGLITLPPEVPTEFDFTDLGNAERIFAQYGSDLHYIYLRKQWYIWNGRYWVPDTAGRIEKIAKEIVREVIENEIATAEDASLKKRLIKHKETSSSARCLKNMVEVARSEGKIPIEYDQLDSNEWLLNCTNGTLDLTKGELISHNREHLITKTIPYPYEPGAECPTFIKFLRQILNDNENLINFIHKAVGYSLTGSNREQCMFILHGSGKNGKSTLVTALMDMLGKDYAKQTAHNALLIKKNETISEDVAVLAGARLVATSETERGAQLAETLVKQIAGGDKIRARFLHQNSFEFTPSYKIWMATNHKPEIKGTDEGIWRKMRLIPFEVKITEAQKDVFLPDKLKLELPGILAWAVEGCKKWLSEGLESPPEVLRATAQYRAEMDVIAAFVEEKCVIKEGAFIQARKLYNIFSIWAKESGEKEMTEKKFSLDLKGRGYESKKRSGYNVWLGIGERTDEDRERYDLGAEGAGLRDEEIF